ncbi:sensor histidine kinase [Erythrobacter sp. THAF29]|uniref:sensor histidine kinase n=1 Tax=Erythrobacter sp. THAF29 TaxID=2587851 RepID=UPI0012692AC8|nr:histidine kinase [Erythrobacter sp. THAF29]QFT76445.1 Sensor histidine kinase YpdA [Erythrobacter sp. THAF29]
MPVLKFQPAPFFSSKNRAFWYLQIGGWAGAFLMRAVIAIANNQPLDLFAVILVNIITGFSITLVLSVIYRQLISRPPIVMWSMAALALGGAVILHTSIDAWVQGIYYGSTRETTFAQRFIALSFIPMMLLGAWSALYFAINYFLTVEQQADRLERLEAQTTAAQLAMLRYQLNPHFLFNTLNSISTLVLLKQTEPANAMLTRLSSFLRHTLIAEPGSQVTLGQEIETLQLYLGIERMRFEDRLRTHFEIDEEAMQACLPSMLLQPLVENAIKYAVSPQEEGARISVTAHVAGGRLRVSVEDSGPGIDGPLQQALFEQSGDVLGQPVSTGVGLANIRNRLTQAYGDNHVFETRSEPGGGFKVFIEIPYEEASAEEPEADNEATTAPDSASPEPSADNVINLNPPRAIGSTP